MVVDTELHGKEGTLQGGKAPLEVDQFPHGYAEGPRERPIAVEAALCLARDGAILFAVHNAVLHEDPSKDYPCIQFKTSIDKGRTWGDSRLFCDADGNAIRSSHHTMLRLPSGRLGLVYATRQVPQGRTGRDGGTVFRTSDDEGRTWSHPVVIESRFGICCTGHAIVMAAGRIVVPVFKWISHDPTGEAEEFNAASVSYSYAYVSDDEGLTWTQSLSELFVSHYRAAYDLEEPAVVELKDGRLLMHLRSQLGRGYRSFSADGGISWSRPEPLPYAAGYTPHCLKRLPSGELLTIWTQVSRQEILTGLHRHRLTCAISRDQGHTWENFKNLESLDDATVVNPPPTDRLEVMEQWEDYDYYQPVNTKRYHRAPGVLRIGYPDALFVGDQAIVVYDHGKGTLGEAGGIKVRIVPLRWLRE